MKRIISLSLIAASLFAVSCSKEIRTDAVKNKVILGASLEQQFSETKTSLGTGNTVVWTAGDKLSVLSTAKATGGDVFTLETGAGAVSGTFKGELSAADIYYAVYPYSTSAKLEGGNIVFNVPATQTYVEGSFANNANVSIAPFSAATANSLSFLNVFGVFKLQLKGDDCAVTSLVLTDLQGAALSGTASVSTSSVTSSNPTAVFTNGSPSVTLNCTSAVALNTTTSTPFYFVVPVGALDHGFKVKVFRTGGYNTLLTINPNIIKRSTILQMPEKTLGAAETEVDLSENGTSNCYVVTEAGDYKFNAKIQGNAKTATMTPTNAILIWEENHSSTAPATAGTIVSNPTLDGDYVKFSTTGTPGNALIAVTNGTNILWSWHIWCVSDLTDKGPFPNGKYCIDRELGALSSAKDNVLSAGLRYQWGRKDPFMGPANYKSSSSAEFGAKYSNGYSFQNPKTKCADVATSVKTPTTIYATSSGWLNTNDNTLWGDTKTIYDPCPVGYKVAPKGTWTGAHSTSVFTDWATGYPLSYKSVDLGFFPAAGFRYTTTGLLDSVSTYIYCWSSCSSGGAASFLYAISSTFSPESTYTNNHAYACPVRCCKE